MRGRLVGGFFLPLLLVASCADNDRYEFLTAPVPGPQVGADGGDVTRIELPELGGLDNSTPAIGPEADLFIGRDEHVVRVRGDRYDARLWPGTGDVRGLVRDATGVPWALDDEGTVARFEGEDWVLGDPVPDEGFRHLGLDGQGRLVAAGREGLVWRREAAGWREMTPPVPADFHASWSAPGQPLVLAGILGDSCAVLILEDDVWRTSLLEATAADYGGLRFAAADTGTMCVGRGGHTSFHLKTGAVWSEATAPTEWGSCFWQDDLLHLAGAAIQVLEDGDWVEHELEGSYPQLAVPAGTGHLLLKGDGSSALWRDGAISGFSRGLGWIEDVTADGDGALVMVTSTGTVLRREGGSWRRVTCLGGCDDLTIRYPQGIHGAADGSVLVADRHDLYRLVADSLVPVPGCDDIVQLYPQADGTLVVMGARNFWHWSGGSLALQAGSRLQIEGLVRDVALHQGVVHVLTTDALLRLEDGIARPLLTFPNQAPGLLRSDPELGLLIGGTTLLAWREGELRDLGPRRPDDVQLTGLIGDGNGGRLVYDGMSRELLHYEEGVWTILNPPGPIPGVTDLQRLADGRYLLPTNRHVWLLQPEFPW